MLLRLSGLLRVSDGVGRFPARVPLVSRVFRTPVPSFRSRTKLPGQGRNNFASNSDISASVLDLYSPPFPDSREKLPLRVGDHDVHFLPELLEGVTYGSTKILQTLPRSRRNTNRISQLSRDTRTGALHLFQGGMEGSYQVMRQLADKAHSVTHDDFLALP